MADILTISGVVQIAILYAAIYAILKRVKGSRVGQALLGVALLAALAVVFTYVLHFDVLAQVVKQILIYFALSTVVIFQPEIRRALSSLGAFSAFDRPRYTPDGAATPATVVAILLALADRRIGALLAFERGISLRGYEEDGIRVDARLTRELVQTIFTPPLPLHDGGMTIRQGRISAAHCIFPVSNNPSLAERGMRHRAGLGLSEETDALVVVVSEETGRISLAHNGRMFTCPEGEAREAALTRWITKAMGPNARRAPFERLLSRLSRLASRFARPADAAADGLRGETAAGRTGDGRQEA